MKKFILGAGALVATAAPLAAVVACGKDGGGSLGTIITAVTSPKTFLELDDQIAHLPANGPFSAGSFDSVLGMVTADKTKDDAATNVSFIKTTNTAYVLTYTANSMTQVFNITPKV